MKLKLMDSEYENNNEATLIKKSHKELTSLIQERIKNFGLQQELTVPLNCKQISKSKIIKDNIQQSSQTRSLRLNSRTNISSKTIDDNDILDINKSINNENFDVASQPRHEEDKKERIILKLNLKKFNLNSDALNSNKRKNSFSGDEKIYENKLINDLGQSNKYFKNELNADVSYDEDSDEDSVTAAASAMMELSNSAY